MWPEAWTQLGNAAQKNEKQEWANEKPELDGARGIHFIDPQDGECEETIKNARRKLDELSGN